MVSLGKLMGFLATKDAARARSFFEGKLGLGFVSQDQFALVLESNGTTIRVSKVENFLPAPYTVLGWEVQDIKSLVVELSKRGVPFEKFPFLQDKELGIWTSPSGARVAWFKDPDGNILSLTQKA